MTAILLRSYQIQKRGEFGRDNSLEVAQTVRGLN